ncbi:biopolymer transporter ExbD [Dysgonomonas sp. BGC7]|uniref:ExbD/TolR family protein n=1 Tax=Dysgonomonas sp. BGC7 TaxID=1658008 RepID=UPI00067FB53B|nr:biopolymer transporter ExbD [Dysgonomonas sp. BGC7]MBD8387074.1 biopolymer transporter ExbD [Dysgonomonas sp. BGC7]
MANIDTNSGNDGKKGKPQRQTLRVDFTPMVDMNMLLITFFMFCTTLSIPQVMDVAMPADSDTKEKISDKKSVTVILGEHDKVYYYEGKANYEDYASLKETNTVGLRDMLIDKNTANYAKIKDLKTKRFRKEISEESFKMKLAEVNRSKDGAIVLIKPTKESNFKNLVDVLDEMQICGVGKYAIVDLEDGDKFLMENLKSKGTLTAMAE